MSLDLDTLRWKHAGSGEQTGESAEEAGHSDEEPTVGTKLRNPAGEFGFTFLVRPEQVSYER